MAGYLCLTLVSCDPDVWVPVEGYADLSPKPVTSGRLLAVRDFIRAYIDANHGVAPSYREVAAFAGISGSAATQRLIWQLEQRGLIRRLPYRARAIEILEAV